MTTGTPPRADAAGTWRQLQDLRDDGEAQRQLALVLAECEGMRDVATAFLASRYAWPLARLAVVPVVRTGRALVFTPPRLWLRMDPRGLVTGIAVPDARLGADGGGADDDGGAGGAGGGGGGDPAAARADAVGRAVAGHRIVVAALRDVGALGDRALWGQLSDHLVTTVGQHLAADMDARVARAVADGWLRAADPPLWVHPRCATVPAGDGVRLAWRRGSCCLAYRLPWFGLCTGCPLQDDDEWLAAASG